MTELKPVFTVSELNEYVGLMLSRDPFMGELTVTGEISAFKRHTSGHLYFTLKDDAASVPSDEQFAAAEAKAQELLDGWKKGEATEDSFAALAAEHSADTSSAANGGLLAGVKRSDTYIQEFKDWALDPSRKVGDTGLVKNTGSSVMGWHVMYYVGDGMPYWKQLADSALRNADYAAWETEVTQGYEAQEGFGMKLM